MYVKSAVKKISSFIETIDVKIKSFNSTIETIDAKIKSFNSTELERPQDKKSLNADIIISTAKETLFGNSVQPYHNFPQDLGATGRRYGKGLHEDESL